MRGVTENSGDDSQAEVIGHYNPVNVTDTMGVILIGTIAIILLFALLRAQARNRSLAAQLAQSQT